MAAYAARANLKAFVFVPAGQIALGKPCSTTFKVGTYHYLVNRADVTFTMTPRSTNLVTKCERR